MQNLNKIVRIKTIETKTALNLCLKHGWQLLKINDDDTYEIGLPIEAAYYNDQRLITAFNKVDGFVFLIKELEKTFKSSLKDYDRVSVSQIHFNSTTHTKNYTHYVAPDDHFNQQLNEYILLSKAFAGELFAKPFSVTDHKSENTKTP